MEVRDIDIIKLLLLVILVGAIIYIVVKNRKIHKTAGGVDPIVQTIENQDGKTTNDVVAEYISRSVLAPREIHVEDYEVIFINKDSNSGALFVNDSSNETSDRRSLEASQGSDTSSNDDGSGKSTLVIVEGRYEVQQYSNWEHAGQVAFTWSSIPLQYTWFYYTKPKDKVKEMWNEIIPRMSVPATSAIAINIGTSDATGFGTTPAAADVKPDSIAPIASLDNNTNTASSFSISAAPAAPATSAAAITNIGISDANTSSAPATGFGTTPAAADAQRDSIPPSTSTTTAFSPLSVALPYYNTFSSLKTNTGSTTTIASNKQPEPKVNVRSNNQSTNMMKYSRLASASATSKPVIQPVNNLPTISTNAFTFAPNTTIAARGFSTTSNGQSGTAAPMSFEPNNTTTASNAQSGAFTFAPNNTTTASNAQSDVLLAFDDNSSSYSYESTDDDGDF